MSASKLATGSRRSREVATMGDESELATLFEADGSTRTWRLPGYARKAINKAREKDRRFFERNPGVWRYERSYVPGEYAHEFYQHDGECPTHVFVGLMGLAGIRAYCRQPVQ